MTRLFWQTLKVAPVLIAVTTKLKGEVLFTIADTFGDVEGEDDPTETTFSDRIQDHVNIIFSSLWFKRHRPFLFV